MLNLNNDDSIKVFLKDNGVAEELCNLILQCLYDNCSDENVTKNDLERANEELRSCCGRQLEEIVRLREIEKKYEELKIKFEKANHKIEEYQRHTNLPNSSKDNVTELQKTCNQLKEVLQVANRKLEIKSCLIRELKQKLQKEEGDAKKYRELRKLLK